MSIHPARRRSYHDIKTNLDQRVAEGKVWEKTEGSLSIYVYSKDCAWERAWDDYTMMARGLILDHEAKKVIATPFPKFFNYGERADDKLPNLPFEAYEKVDGSLGIIFQHNGEWRVATKGSFQSAQAVWATNWLCSKNTFPLIPGATYLAEIVYPENKIVIRYEEQGLIFLGGYYADGTEMVYDDILDVAFAFDTRAATPKTYQSLLDILDVAKKLPGNDEGFVVRYDNGYRVKIKGAEYCRLHALISEITPLAIWDMMRFYGTSTSKIQHFRKDIPEEFAGDFDTIHMILLRKVNHILETIRIEAERYSHLSDKELGMLMKQDPKRFNKDTASLIFPYRKDNDAFTHNHKFRRSVFNMVRPTGNVLDGYSASYAMGRVFEEAA
jgi:RNA ligase